METKSLLDLFLQGRGRGFTGIDTIRKVVHEGLIIFYEGS
jgi:hypothetical protein